MVLHTPIRLKSCTQAVVPTLAGLHARVPGGTIGQTGAPDSGRYRPHHAREHESDVARRPLPQEMHSPVR